MNSSNEIENSVNLVKNKKLTKIESSYIKKWLVEGRTNTYMVIGNTFCSCENFIVRSLKQVNSKCYHIMATELIDEQSDIPSINDIDINQLLENRKIKKKRR
jgi:predicted nucleic acid-binding Zn finger protein